MNSVCELLTLERPLVMGILNTTPDSFSDGGLFAQLDRATEHAMQMIAHGADIIDVGGESTRPGADEVSLSDEMARVIPVIQQIKQQSSVAISIDTSKTEVMRAAIDAGAVMVNDVNALRAEGAIDVCADSDVSVCLMHMQGEPRHMQKQPTYAKVVADVRGFLEQRIEACVAKGISEDRIVIDPGFGFGKNLSHNLQLLKHLSEIVSLGRPVLVGLSRKSMLGQILDEAPAGQRLYASIAAAVLSRANGARLFRVHDVGPTIDALKVCHAVERVDQI